MKALKATVLLDNGYEVEVNIQDRTLTLNGGNTSELYTLTEVKSIRTTDYWTHDPYVKVASVVNGSVVLWIPSLETLSLTHPSGRVGIETAEKPNQTRRVKL